MASAQRPFRALALRLLAILCLSTMGALIKLLDARGVGLVETVFLRQVLAVPFILGFVLAGPGMATLRTARLKAHAARAAIGLVAMFASFGALTLLPLAEATTLSFTGPLFATLLSILFLGERPGTWRWGAIVAGFLGVLIVLQPGSGHLPLLGGAVGLTAAFGVALISILLRQLGATEPATTTAFWFAVLTLPVVAVPYALKAQPHDTETWALLLALGASGAVAQLALTAALRWAPVSTVIVMDYSALIWATLYGYALFGALPSATTWMGAPLVIGSGLVILWREHAVASAASAASAAEAAGRG